MNWTLWFLSFSWGISNRGRGWAPRANAPEWQHVASKILGRDTMAAWHGLTVIWASLTLDVPLWWQGSALALCTALLWRFAVTPGWGEYQDGQDPANEEIQWIDWLVIRYMPDRLDTGKWFDGVSMGLRGVYYVPIYIAAGLIMQSWAFALPAALFWHPGVVYGYLWHRKVPGDFVRLAELIDDTIRGLLFFAAFYLSVN